MIQKTVGRKLLSFLLSLAMVLGMMSMAAFADDTETKKDNGNFTVTVTNNDTDTGHQYNAYQIFKGDLVEKEGATATNTGANLILSNIEWGDGVTSTTLLEKIISANSDSSNALYGCFAGITTSSSAADVAKKLDGINDEDVKAQAFAELVQDSLSGTKTTGSARRQHTALM